MYLSVRLIDTKQFLYEDDELFLNPVTPNFDSEGYPNKIFKGLSKSIP
jgi:hypothetical protein